MTDVAIHVENLSKRYRLGQRERYKTLRDTLARAATASLHALRRRGSKQLGGTETFWALRNVSFEIKEGEVLGIIGRNGAGKSTLLKILSRITEPTQGHIEIRGRVGSLLEVGTGFHPELTGRENVYLNAAILGMKRWEIDQKFDEIVQFAGVEKFLDTPVKRYSSGMYVRLAFAVAAHLEPEILIIDEVLSVGDAEFQKKSLGKMRDISQRGQTVLFVSHNMSAVRNLCNRVVLLNQGAIEMEGAVPEVLQHYAHIGEEFSDGCRTWGYDERPGNRYLSLSSVSLKNVDGQMVSRMKLSEDAIIEMDWEVHEQNTKALFSLVLFDAEGNCLFGSLSNNEGNFHGKRLHPGTYRSQCCIHGNLLNVGRYYISLFGFSNGWSENAFSIHQVISFEIVEDGILRGDYYGDYEGPLRPKLPWKTTMWEDDSGLRPRL